MDIAFIITITIISTLITATMIKIPIFVYQYCHVADGVDKVTVKVSIVFCPEIGYKWYTFSVPHIFFSSACNYRSHI